MHLRRILALLLALALLPLTGCTVPKANEETVTVFLLADHNTTVGGREHERKTYEYDADGILIAHTEYLKGEEYARGEYAYDAQGSQTAFTLFGTNGEVIGEHWTREFEYDSRGRVIRQASTYCGIDSYIHSYAYDEAGNLISQMTYEPTGELHMGTDLEYSQNGQISRKIIYSDPEKTDATEQEYTYDKAGRLTGILQYRGDVRVVKSEWEYDPDGRILQENHYENNGAPFASTEYIYDTAGKLQTEIVYLGRNEQYRLQYFYDNRDYVTRINKELPTGAVYNQSCTYKQVSVPVSCLERLEKQMAEYDIPYFIVK